MSSSNSNKFEPHAVIRTDMNGRPRQITIAGACNASRLLRINFPSNMGENDRLAYAIQECEMRKVEIEGFFYPIIDLVINHTQEKAEVITLEGKRVAELNTPALLPIVEAKLL